MRQEARDGYDIVEWVAAQPFCNGKVAMFSGSYEGYVQWATAKEFPPHLTTIVPGMAAAPGIDFPIRNNIMSTYVMRWLTLIAGRTSQERIFEDEELWRARFSEWYKSGRAFEELDVMVGVPSPIFQEWLTHPTEDHYWDSFRPTHADFAQFDLPILTLTGSYDGDQPGALHYYREHLRHSSQEFAARHYLVIGPWDHGGTLAPRSEFGGIKLGQAAIIDILKLHLEWYDWAMRGGPRPCFLQKRVAYYVAGAEKWRYADSLEEVTAESRSLFLASSGSASKLFGSGVLTKEPGTGQDEYAYDPRDTSIAELESISTHPLCFRPTFPTDNLTDQTQAYCRDGKQLIYHSAPFETDVEVSGFFQLVAWISIDTPDTDFCVCVYEIDTNGASMLLSTESLRARYREGRREAKLISTPEPLRYDFNRFTFISRIVRKGSRLRLVIGPLDSIHYQRNYNSGRPVSKESIADARTVRVRLFHDDARPSALHVPIGLSGT
jgi:putative CocE/NonD family hydrolase